MNISFRELTGKGRNDNFLTAVRSALAQPGLNPCLLTVAPPLRSDGDYTSGDDDAVVTIQDFAERFSITESGISRPKIIECRGSDGVTRKQLVKGGDDMRQDAVMQQV